MIEEPIYIKKIKQTILSYIKEVNEVNELKFLKILDYSNENLKTISELIANKKIDELENLHANNNEEENLIVMSFEDKNGNLHYVVIYDNEELWHNPKIISMY